MANEREYLSRSSASKVPGFSVSRLPVLRAGIFSCARAVGTPAFGAPTVRTPAAPAYLACGDEVLR